MLIKYTPKVEHLKCVVLTPKEGLKLERTMVRLLPGTNEPTDDEWKAMRGNIVEELNRDEIKILAQKVSAGRGKVGGTKAKNLKQMPVNLAIKYVSECNNPDTLEKWYKEITNEEVRLAVVKKFKKLEIELPEDKTSEDKLPNESPMTLAEFDEDDESEEDEDSDEDFENDDENDEESEIEKSEDSENDYNNMKVSELKTLCEEKGIDTTGLKKPELIEALTAKESE